MFGNRYFASRYFADRYWAPGGEAEVARVDRGGDGFSRKPAKTKKPKAHGRVRYLVYANEQIESVPAKPEGEPQRVTTAVVEEALETTADRLGWTPATAKAALPQVVYFKAPPTPEDRSGLIRAIAEYLRIKAAEEAEEDDIELLLLAA